MKIIITALTLLSLAASPVFAAPFAWQLHEGRASAFVPGYSMDFDTSREGQIHAN
jgi:hypothetical protein